MTTHQRYAMPVDPIEWTLPSRFDSLMRWEYEDGRASLLNLYEKGKERQWNGNTRIDWSLDLDPENPQELPDEQISIFGSDIWHRLTKTERANLRRHLQAQQLSQFMHGEQGALLCASKIVQQVPSIDAKFYAATQVVDEARHVEVYARLLHQKFELAYPITPTLKSLLDNVLTDARWDMTYLGMQVLIEGLALAAFASIRDHARNPLAAAVNAYVMEDEARHVAFGRIALRDYYPQLSDAERREREEFVIEGCYHLRDRFNSPEMWERLGIDLKDALREVDGSEGQIRFRKRLFSRIVPIVKDIGLWSERVRKVFVDMQVIHYGDTDPQAMLDHDAAVAEEFDKLLGKKPVPA